MLNATAQNVVEDHIRHLNTAIRELPTGEQVSSISVTFHPNGSASGRVLMRANFFIAAPRD